MYLIGASPSFSEFTSLGVFLTKSQISQLKVMLYWKKQISQFWIIVKQN